MTQEQARKLSKTLYFIEQETSEPIESSGCDLCGTVRLPLHKIEHYKMPSGRNMRLCDECKETL